MLKFIEFQQAFQLESGEVLPRLKLAYSTIGNRNADSSNVIWICHALTANASPKEWWAGLFEKNNAIDLNQYFVVCVNILGSCYGSTNPKSINPKTGEVWGLKFPKFTIRDITKGLDMLRQQLRIQQIQYLIGGSMGGMQAMEWAIEKPNSIKNLIVLASSAKHSPWGIAFNETQRMALESDPTFWKQESNAGKKGLETARAIALLSYRNYNTYQKTQMDNKNRLDNYSASSYQRYQGEKLAKRFDAQCYWYLSKAMDSHDVGRSRVSCKKALALITAKTLVIGIESDVLFPVEEQKFLAQNIPNAQLEIIHSIYGHDGFLIEVEQIKEHLHNHFKL